jgi:hypothetical protein
VAWGDPRVGEREAGAMLEVEQEQPVARCQASDRRSGRAAIELGGGRATDCRSRWCGLAEVLQGGVDVDHACPLTVDYAPCPGVPGSEAAVLQAALAFLAPTASAQALEITVADPAVIALVLECADGAHKAVVKSGKATLEQVPQGCVVNMIRKSGTIDAPGRWTCTLDACMQEEVDHHSVSDAEGRVNVVITTPLPKGSYLELTCGGGVRMRADIDLNTAVFDAVPDGDCTLLFKGGVPAKYQPVRFGTFYCGLSGTTAVCTQR